MVKRPQDYIWSSFGEYSGLADSHVSEPEFVMESFGSSSAESIRKYAEFCGIDDSEEIKKLIYGQFVIGSREFTDKVKKICAAGGKNLSGEISGGRKIKTRNSKDKIINETARAYGVTAEKVLKKQGLPRQTAMYLIRKHTDMKLKDIAEMFGGMHYTAVNKTVMRFEKKAQLAEIRIKLGIIEAVFVK